MTNCTDIIVTIINYSAADSFEAAVRVKGTLLEFDNVPSSYRQVATSNQIRFTGLPDEMYEVSVRRTCSTGDAILSDWQDINNLACKSPASIAISGITGTSANVAWTASDGSSPATGYEYRINKSPDWKTTTVNPIALTGLTAGIVYDVELRQSCSLNSKSSNLRKFFATTVGAASMRVDVIQKLCSNGLYDGFRIRISLAGGVAAVGKIYTLKYNDPNAGLQTFATYTVVGGDTIEKVIKGLWANLNVQEIYFDNTTGFGYMDFISREIVDPVTLHPPCNNVALTTLYQCSIV
jgi:hypothetical protein